jgi:hypothetical protein
LADGGIFIAEDLHASYWQEYGGGLYYPYSALMLFKRLVDIIHHEHWGVTKSRVDILAGFLTKYKMHSVWEDALQHVHSVEFVNSMCIVRKARAESNQLGARILRGSDAMIEPGTAWAGGQVSQAPDQSSNWWATLPSPPDEELPRQIEKAAMLELTAEALMARIESMQQATSWRITAPLRRLGDFLTTITKRNHINSSMTKDVPPRQE